MTLTINSVSTTCILSDNLHKPLVSCNVNTFFRKHNEVTNYLNKDNLVILLILPNYHISQYFIQKCFPCQYRNMKYLYVNILRLNAYIY